MLVRTEELAQHLTDPSWVIFDCRHDLFDFAKGERVYRESHIPSAHFAPVETALSGSKTGQNGRHPLPAPAAFADFLAQRGVSNASVIVAYDDVGGQYAARLWWMTRWIGLTGGVVLDGGFPKWVAEKRPVTSDIPALRRGDVRPGPSLVHAWTTDDVLRRMNDPQSSVVDARAAERYRGETEPIDRVAGRIPGAVNRFFKLNLNPDLTLRAPTELKREFESLLAGRAPENIAHHCGSGITACANLLAMEYAGLPGSNLYVGSWSEWIADPERPIAKG